MKWKKDNSAVHKSASSVDDDDETSSDKNQGHSPDIPDFASQSTRDDVNDDKPEATPDYNDLNLSLQVSEPLDKLASLSKSAVPLHNIVDPGLQPLPIRHHAERG